MKEFPSTATPETKVTRDILSAEHPERLSYRSRILLMAVVPVYFIVIGLLVSPIGTILPGLYRILVQPDLLITDYMVIGGIGAAFLNAGVLTLLLLFFIYRMRIPFDGHMISSCYLMFGFSLFGKNLVNIWLILFGYFMYCKIHHSDWKKYLYIGFYGTSLSPAITLLMQLGRERGTLAQMLLALVTGISIGYVLKPIALHVRAVHKGYSLYNVGFATGVIATIMVSLFRSFGIRIPTRQIWGHSYNHIFSVALTVFFLGEILLGVFLKGPAVFQEYGRLLKETGVAPSDYSRDYSTAVNALSMGVNGLFATWFLLLLGCHLNGPTIGSIFTVVGFSPTGKHIRNIAPVMFGVVLAGATKQWELSEPGPTLTILLSTTLAPFAGEFGILIGVIAGFIHSSVALNVGIVAKGLNLYNNGFAGGMVAMFLLPVLESIHEELERAAVFERRLLLAILFRRRGNRDENTAPRGSASGKPDGDPPK